MNTPQGPELHDIHLPPPPSWWPPAPGWWVLAVLILACCIFTFVAFHKKRQGRRRHMAILAELDRCIAGADGDPAILASNLSQFLRRIALRDSSSAAALTGERWLAYLDRRVQTNEFSTGIGRVLIDAPFLRVPDYDIVGLTALVRRWTRQVLTTAPHA